MTTMTHVTADVKNAAMDEASRRLECHVDEVAGRNQVLQSFHKRLYRKKDSLGELWKNMQYMCSNLRLQVVSFCVYL